MGTPPCSPLRFLLFGLCILLGFTNGLVSSALLENAPAVVVGAVECLDCAQKNIKAEDAFNGLRVAIKCKAKDKYETKAIGELEAGGSFSLKLPAELLQDGGSLKHEQCFAQLHAAENMPCPDAKNSLNPTAKIVLKESKEDETKHYTYVVEAGKLSFSSATCVSAFLWHKSFPKFPKFSWHPLHKHFPWHKPLPKFHLPPKVPIYKLPVKTVPIYKPPVTPVPIYKPPVPVYKPSPVPIYKPSPVPKYKPPVPIYKPSPVPTYKPPVPIYKPSPVPKYKPPVPIYKPSPVPKYKPPVPIYKPSPVPVPVYKPSPVPVPVYKPSPVPVPVPVYKPSPVPVPIYKPPIIIPKFSFPKIHKKPLPPIPKLPPLFHKPKPKFSFPPIYKKPLPPFPHLPPKFKFPPSHGWPWPPAMAGAKP